MASSPVRQRLFQRKQSALGCQRPFIVFARAAHDADRLVVDKGAQGIGRGQRICRGFVEQTPIDCDLVVATNAGAWSGQLAIDGHPTLSHGSVG